VIPVARVALASAVLLALAAPALAASPSIHMGARNPLVVTGKGFKAGEKVVVTANRRGSRQAVVAASGAFRVRFGSAAGTSCEAISIRAVGSRGSRATLTVKRPSGCATTPPPTTPQPPSDPAYPGA
jgi:hypothetical protein